MAAAKLGGRCAFGGMLGEDDLSRSVEENFRCHGIDVSATVRSRAARPIHAVIIVAEDEQTRNVFYEFSAPIGADIAGPTEDQIRSARVLFVDHIGVEGGLRAAEIARKVGVPIVCDFEEVHDPKFLQLLELVDHLVLSEEFAMKITAATTATSALKELWNPKRDSVVITRGRGGAIYISKNEAKPQHQEAFPVNAVDTTGCGDVFHGAYALALARGKDVAERVRFASAAAALKATKTGGQRGAPNEAELSHFLDHISASSMPMENHDPDRRS